MAAQTENQTPAELRRRRVHRSELAKISKHLAHLANQISDASEEVSGMGLVVDGVTKIDRGIELIEAYITNLKIALIKAES